MATHKVPQDVEAEDKLIGPFSFRQLIFLLIGGGCGFLCYLLATRIAIPLAILPAPFAVFFVVIALPIKKDQPMEVYIASLIKYYFLRSKTRVWKADGEMPFIEISAPVVEEPATKDISGDEVSRRLSFLANITDTQGWSTRGYTAPNDSNLNDEYASSAATAPDILDADSPISDAIGDKLERADLEKRARAVSQMNDATRTAGASTQQTGSFVQRPVAPAAIAPQPAYTAQAPAAAPTPTNYTPISDAQSAYRANYSYVQSVSTPAAALQADVSLAPAPTSASAPSQVQTVAVPVGNYSYANGYDGMVQNAPAEANPAVGSQSVGNSDIIENGNNDFIDVKLH